MKLIVTKQFDRAVKAVKKKHDPQLKAELIDKITKIYKRNLAESDCSHQLKGKHTNGLQDVHISGDLIILYRYDEDTDTLVISAKLHDIVDHHKLKEKDTFKEKEGFERDFDEYIKEIQSSIVLEEIPFEDIDSWFTDYYNDCISDVVCIDDIAIDDVIDKGSHLVITASGYQYFSTCPADSLKSVESELNASCNEDGICCKLVADYSITDPYHDPDSYLLMLIAEVPVSVGA